MAHAWFCFASGDASFLLRLAQFGHQQTNFFFCGCSGIQNAVLPASAENQNAVAQINENIQILTYINNCNALRY